jgi:[protein-PII] uridylyltransferase
MILCATPAFAPLLGPDALPEPDGSTANAGAVARAYLAQARAEVRRRHDAGAGGCAVVAAYTDAIDRLITFLYTQATLHYATRNPLITQRCTVLPQGGYGRGELNPASDVDLLFLYPWKVNPYVETVAEVILYALWDAGLEVGHALRNTRECGRLAARDLKAKTAVLDARYLCGDRALYDEFAAQTLEEVWSDNPTAFFKVKLAESADRHAQAGDSVYLLQPQVKEGQGGLRDLHTALWMAKVKFKVHTFRDLITIGVVSERDVAQLEEAVEFLMRLRNAMHLTAGAHQDQLTFELQDRLAPALGFPDGRAGVEAFMRRYFGHATTINRFSDAVIARCVQPPDAYRGTPPLVRTIREGMRIQGRTLSVTGGSVFEDDPSAVLWVFVEAQRHGVTIGAGTRTLIADVLPLLAAARDTSAVAEAFLAVLRGRGHVYETVAEMHKLGVLIAVIPEFGNLECLISHDPFHIYTVDHHSLMGIREIERLRAGEFARTLPHVTQVMNEAAQPELLFLGMMFHDIGKGHGHDHETRGALMTRDITRRLRLNVDEQAACEFLVQHHLLMSHLAQRRDLNDDQLVSDFCRTVGSVENLQRLYLLTYADMRAVAPGVWNNWRDTLVTELYVRAREFFEKGVYQAEDRAARAARVRTRVQGAADGRQADVGRFLQSMPDSYVLSTPEGMLAQHADLWRRFRVGEASDEQPAMATDLVHHADRGWSEFSVCTRDRPGLFSMLSGVLAAHGMNILAARITTSNDGVALDAFRISHQDFDVAHDGERWERVGGTLRRVLAGTADVEDIVRRSGRPSILTRRRRRPIPTTVEIDNSVSRDFTVLDVYSWDRVGLLFRITNCLYHLWLEIHLAKINTMVDQVLDVFYVTDHEGRKIEDPARLEQIRAELTRALTEDETVGGSVEARAAGS